MKKYINYKHGKYKTRLYRIWDAMICRTVHIKNKESAYWKHYKGRGISVCDEWRDYLIFEKWAYENGYKDDLTIDRIDVNGDYCPENCRWATRKEQANNRRDNCYITFNGETHTMSQWSDITGISYSTLEKRHRRGEDVSILFRNPNRGTPVISIDNDGNKTYYESAYIAAKQTGINCYNITRVCKGLRRTTHGLKWEYANQESA